MELTEITIDSTGRVNITSYGHIRDKLNCTKLNCNRYDINDLGYLIIEPYIDDLYYLDGEFWYHNEPIKFENVHIIPNNCPVKWDTEQETK
jgi:hypothetical protein